MLPKASSPQEALEQLRLLRGHIARRGQRALCVQHKEAPCWMHWQLAMYHQGTAPGNNSSRLLGRMI